LKAEVGKFRAGIGLEGPYQLRPSLGFKPVICELLDNVQTEHYAKDSLYKLFYEREAGEGKGQNRDFQGPSDAKKTRFGGGV
jgi:hypothetical protein